jgi:hypothetical protein
MWPRGKAGRGTTGPMPASVHYAQLRRASQPRRWALAWMAGAVIGAVLTASTSWWVGQLAGSLIVAGLPIWDHRSGVLGAWPGDQGCYRLVAGAARLERRGWAVLRAPAIPDQDPGRTAYLLIGAGGVFVVEHQVWAAGEGVTISSRSGLLEVGGRPAARRTTAVRAAAATVDEALSDALSREIPIHPVLAIHGLTLDRPQVTVGVTILPIAHLARVVHDSTVLLSTADVDSVAATARRLFTPGTTP